MWNKALSSIKRKKLKPCQLLSTESKSRSFKGKDAVSSLKKKMPGSKSETASEVTKKKRFQGSTAGLEEYILYYGKGMDATYLISKDKLLTYIKKKYTTSERISIEKNSVSLVGIVKSQVFPTKVEFE